MNYSVKNIRLAGHKWLADVSYWANCECAAVSKTVEVIKDRRPSNKDFIEALTI